MSHSQTADLDIKINPPTKKDIFSDINAMANVKAAGFRLIDRVFKRQYLSTLNNFCLAFEQPPAHA